MADLSDDELAETTTEVTSAELDEQLEDTRLARSFRKCSFWGACGFTAVYLLAFLVWACVLLRGFMRHPNFMDNGNHLWTICLITLAIIPTTMALALLRFAFKEQNEGKSEKDLPSVWLQLAKELADVIKQYISKKV